MTEMNLLYDGKSPAEIVAEFRRRQNERGPFFERARIISQHYDNQVVLPLPEVGPQEAPAVANLLAQGIDQHAMRVGSVNADVQAPALKPGDKASEKRADQRRRACLGFWEVNDYELFQKRRARWLVAYAEAPVRLAPDSKSRMPKWVQRTPFETYPSAMDDAQMQPDNCIFAVHRSVGWLRTHYPQIPVDTITYRDSGPFVKGRKLNNDDMIEVVEWLDGNETCVVVIGHGECTADMIHEAEFGVQGARIINLGPAGPGQLPTWVAPILRVPNRIGACPVVVPGRISLGARKGQFDDSVGLYQMQAKLMAMEVNAVANGIWPDLWLVGGQGANPQVIKEADGRKGQIGVVSDGQLVPQQIQPGLQTNVVIDRLERGIRQNSGIPADFGGESASNIRTGRRGDAVLSAAVDYYIQEHQQILARSAQTELQIAASIDLAHYGNERKSFYVSWKHGKGRLDYTPKDIWTEDRTIRVSYAKAGADVQQLTVEVGQLNATGMISKLTAMRMHPDVKDPDFEHKQVLFEGIEQAALSGVQQGVASGTLAHIDAARIGTLIEENGGDLFAAVLKADEEARQRQSTTAAPAEPGSPEAQPGLSPADTAGAEAPPSIAPPPPSLDNLVGMIRNLRTTRQAAGG